MNREYKFRAYGSFGSDKEKKLVQDWQNTEYIESLGFDGGGFFQVSQCIGVNDVNGKKIYEGDIVTYGQLSATKLGEELYEVVYCSENNFPSYGLKSLTENIITPRIEMIKIKTIGEDPNGQHVGIVTGVEHSGIKVVGNIYENPELLE